MSAQRGWVWFLNGRPKFNDVPSMKYLTAQPYDDTQTIWYGYFEAKTTTTRRQVWKQLGCPPDGTYEILPRKDVNAYVNSIKKSLPNMPSEEEYGMPICSRRSWMSYV